MNKLASFIEKITNNQHLDQDEAARAMQIILSGGATPAQIAAFGTALRVKGEKASEISGMVIGLKNKQIIDWPRADLTISGSSNLGMNVITLASCLILAAADIKIIQYISRFWDKRETFEDLASLGINTQINKSLAEEIYKELGIVFFDITKSNDFIRNFSFLNQEFTHNSIFDIIMPLFNSITSNNILYNIYSNNIVSEVGLSLKQLGFENYWVINNQSNLNYLPIEDVSYIYDSSGKQTEAKVTNLDVTTKDSQDFHIAISYQNHITALVDVLAGHENYLWNEVIFNVSHILIMLSKFTNFNDAKIYTEDLLHKGAVKEKMKKLVEMTNKD